MVDITLSEDVWQERRVWAAAVLPLLAGRKRRRQDLCHQELVRESAMNPSWAVDT